MRIFTIGFTKTSAENFFVRLQKSGSKKIVDVRLNNKSQLAGFAKRDDLRYFSREICGMSYEHELRLAPTQDMLDELKKHKGKWADYEKRFMNLIEQRKIEMMSPAELDGACLLCSEDKPHHCHRRLVAEYLQRKWSGVEITHL